MKLVQRSEIDEVKWSIWCEKSPESQPFLSLPYLDAVSENLLFAINDSETGGIPLPYFEKLGVKTLYMPVFCRWIDWIGEECTSSEDLESFLLNNFQECDVYFKRDLLRQQPMELVFQKLNSDQYKLNSQAKRKIKTIEKEGFNFSDDLDIENGVRIIREELTGKFSSLQKSNFDSLEVLLSKVNDINSLMSKLLIERDEVVGALFLVQTTNSILYLKGACSPEAKKKGGMYAMMNAAILDAFESNRTFDFGGSRIEGVRRFNKCFGGQDTNYFHYKWSNGPIWYKAAKSLKNTWKKK